MVENRESRFSAPAYAVADAMMAAQVYMYGLDKDPSRLARAAFQGEGSLALFQQIRTLGDCTKVSKIVMAHIAYNNPNLFSGMALLQGNGSEEQFVNQGWKHHQNFLVRDIAGIWYAGSPANYSPRDPERLTRVISSENLETVLKQIVVHDGGQWPTPDYVQGVFNNHRHRFPQVQTRNEDKGIFTSIWIVREADLYTDRQRVIEFNLYPVDKNKKIVVTD